ncbi:MAG: MOSC domain-containing protein [Acidimicrobiales bacterium]|nr:MOSC domain-containing protein [Acidimicrobiales bacterium]
MTEPAERCDECGFDGLQYDLGDAVGTLRAVPPMWRQLVEGLSEDVLGARPAPDVWSAAEYAAHSAVVTEAMGRLLHGTLVVDDLRVGPLSAAEPDVSRGPAEALTRLTRNVERLYRRARGIGGEDAAEWSRTAVADGHDIDAGWIVRHAVHDATHHLMDAARGLHRLGAGAPTQTGSVVQLSAGGGGVPKEAVQAAEVGHGGLVGDVQADRHNHGRPLQALCLWSAELIDALRGEGHPIHPGACGENVTVAGVDWTTIRTGVRVRIGEVLAEVSAYATPCAKNARWFRDGYFNRMHHDRHPGWSRAYAWVREPGLVRTGDTVVVEPER